MAMTTARGLRVGTITLALAMTVSFHLSKSVEAESGDPSSLPRLSLSNLDYAGAFRLPREMANGNSFSYGGHVVAYNTAYNSLFVSDSGYQIAEVSIPTPVVSADVNALPFAQYLQPFYDPTEGRMSQVAPSGVILEGLIVYNNRLYGSASIFYDANNTQRVSHYSRSLQLNQPSFQGWSQVWEPEMSGYVSGMMAVLPSEWRSLLGGPAITGQCCIAIAWRTSGGPAAFAFDPQLVGQSVVPAAPLVYYDPSHPTLGDWGSSNPTYGGTTAMRGVAVVAGTRTALYFGRNGVGPFCYGNGTTDPSLNGTMGPDGSHWCYDPVSPGKGQHAYPYNYQIWAYDLNDFAAVKAGTKQPWEVVPYGVWPLNLPTPEASVTLGGVGYDPVSQSIYVSQYKADPDGYSSRPLIHVIRVNGSGATTPAVPSTVSAVALTSDKAAPQAPETAITFTAQPSGGVAPYQYEWLISDGVTSTVAVNWTTSNKMTWTPRTANPKYVVSVWVRSAGNTADAFEATTSVSFPIAAAPTAAPASSVTLVANRVAPQPPLTAITWTATPVGGTAPHEYKWLVSDGATSTVGANWSTTNSFVWTPSTANANYRVEVWVRSAGNTADAKEASVSSPFPIASVATPVSSVALSANKAEPQQTGTAITWSAVPSGGVAPFVYKWFVFDGSNWNVAANWNSNAAFAWTPSVANSNYRVRVWVKAASNAADQAEAAADKGFSITAPPAAAPTVPAPVTPVSAVTLTSSKSSPQPAGTSVVFTAQAAGGVGPYQYQWSTFEDDKWSAVGGWGSAQTLTWSRNTANPKYQVQVRVRSAGSTNATGEATATMGFVLNNGNGNGK